MKLRVVQVNCAQDPSGREAAALLQAWPSLALIAQATADAGAEVHVLQSSHQQKEHHADGITYRFVPEMRLRRRGGSGAMPWRLVAEIRRLRPDVIHFHGLAFPLHLRALSQTGPPVFVQDHASIPRQRWHRIRRWSLERVAACAFTSAAQAEPFVRSGELPPHLRIFEIPECSSRFSSGDRDQARQESGIHGDPALLWVGHLNRNKDPLTILRAVRRALESLPELHLWCAYDGSELLTECEALVRSDPLLRRCVHMLGRVPHARIETMCRACDVFVLGSHREGSGYALIEAMACGLVPVVSDIPSFRALTGNGTVGCLAPVGDVEGFAAGIIAQSKTSRTCQAKVTAHFQRHLSPRSVGQQLVDAYECIAGRA